MPEMDGLFDWQTVNWDNMNKFSGTGDLDIRPYYYKVVGTARNPELLLISAVPREGLMHAVDFLRLTYDGFHQLKTLGEKVFKA